MRLSRSLVIFALPEKVESIINSDITAVILHKNQPEQLKSALESVQWCTHRLILDDHSSPSISALARNYKAEVQPVIVHKNFAKARNEAEKHIRTSWILWLDADEVVSKALAEELQHYAYQRFLAGVILHRQDFFLQRTLRYGETGHIQLLRMIRKGKGVWSGTVHETLRTSGKTMHAKENLYHQPHASVSTFLEKIISYAQIAGVEKRIHPIRTILEMFTFPVGKFILNYFLLLGFLDGFPGFCMAYMMSLHSFLVRVYRLEQWRGYSG